jgi:quinol monooxygenase YgiN
MVDEFGAFGLVVRFELHYGHEEAFDALTAETVASIRASEPGTMVYLTHTERESPDVRVFYELYRSEAAFQAHEESEHVRRFLAERQQHLRHDPEVWWVAPSNGVVRPEASPGGA